MAAPRRGQPARSWAEEEAAEAMYNEHVHGDGVVQLGLLKPGGKPAHRFYLLAMARRREGGGGGNGESGVSGGGGRNTSVVPGDRGTRPNRTTTVNERKAAARRARAAKARASGEA